MPSLMRSSMFIFDDVPDLVPERSAVSTVHEGLLVPHGTLVLVLPHLK